MALSKFKLFNFLLIFLFSTTAQDKQVSTKLSGLRKHTRSVSVGSFERLLGYMSQPSEPLEYLKIFEDFIPFRITNIEKDEFAKFYSKLEHGRYLFWGAFTNAKMDFVNKLLDNGLDISGLEKSILLQIRSELFLKRPFLRRRDSDYQRYKKRVKELGVFLNRLIEKFKFDVNVQIRYQRFTKRRERKPDAAYSLLNTVIEKDFEFETIKKIIDAGADLNWKSATQFSPLCCAVWRNRVDVFDYLILKGANLKKSIKEEDLLSYAWSIGEPHLLERMVELTDSNFIYDESNLINNYLNRINSEKNYACLKKSCDSAYYSILLKLVKKFGANQSDKNGRTPLFFAQSKEVVDLLLNNGADINQQDINGETPLINAVSREGMYDRHDAFFNMVGYLIIKGANVNAKDKNGRTPLFFAQSKEVVDLLLDNGADINEQDNNGSTLLSRYLTLYGNYACSSLYRRWDLFLKRGARVDKLNKKGLTVIEELFDLIVRTCKSHYPEDTEKIRYMIDSGLLLLEYGADCDHFRIDTLSKPINYDVVSDNQLDRYRYIKAESLKRKEIQEDIEKYLIDKKTNSFFLKLKSLFFSNPSVCLLNKINYGSIYNLGLLQALVMYRMIYLNPISDYQKYSKLRIALLTIAKKTAQYVFALDRLLNNSKIDDLQLPLDMIEEIIYKNFYTAFTEQEIILKSGQKITFQELVRQEYQQIYANVYTPKKAQ